MIWLKLHVYNNVSPSKLYVLFLSIQLSIHLSIHPSVNPFSCQSIFPSICPSILLSIHPYVHPAVYPSFHPYVHTSFFQSIHLSIHLFQILTAPYLIYNLAWRVSIKGYTSHTGPMSRLHQIDCFSLPSVFVSNTTF